MTSIAIGIILVIVGLFGMFKAINKLTMRDHIELSAILFVLSVCAVVGGGATVGISTAIHYPL